VTSNSLNFSYQGENGSIIHLGKVPSDTIVELNLDQDTSPEYSYLYTGGGGFRRPRYSPALAFSFDVETASENTFIELSNLQDDADLYLAKIDPATNEPETEPRRVNYMRSSSKYELQDESVFAALPSGRYYIEISNNQPNGYIPSLTLRIDTNTFDETTILGNDPLLPQQWYLFNNGSGNESLLGQLAGGIAANVDILAPEAWGISRDATKTVIAVVDTGVDILHPDLASNIWENEDEIPGNGIDDDTNGYIDDINGWNFYDNSSNPSPNADTGSHGTHVAGIIGAKGNNGVGVSGVAWDARIMAINSSTGGRGIDGGKGIEYALDNGANIINMSFGAPLKMHPDRLIDYLDNKGRLIENLPEDVSEFSPIYNKIYSLMQKASLTDTLMVAAAGNDGSYDLSLQGWDGIGNTNASFDWSFFNRFFDNVVVVGSVNAQGRQSYYSSYGNSVDISAPGGDESLMPTLGILSTVPDFDNIYPASSFLASGKLPDGYTVGYVDEDGSKYAYSQGTSMAAPVISGAAGLLRSNFPELSAGSIKQILLKSANRNTRLEGIAGEEGLTLNLYAALELATAVTNGSEDLSQYASTIKASGRRNSFLVGNETNERLIGSSKTDRLTGNSGDDFLKGAGGRDYLLGGAGEDRLVGGEGSDIYVYTTITESGPSTSDIIDYRHNDKIDISRLSAALDSGVEFSFIRENHFSGAPGEVRASRHGLSADLNGDLIPDFRVAFKSPLGFDLDASGIILA
jgi:subtilisin family serine protease